MQTKRVRCVVIILFLVAIAFIGFACYVIGAIRQSNVPHSEFVSSILQVGNKLGFDCKFEATRAFGLDELPAVERLRARFLRGKKVEKVTTGAVKEDTVHEFIFTNAYNSLQMSVAAYESSNEVFLVLLNGKVNSETVNDWESVLHDIYPALRVVRR